MGVRLTPAGYLHWEPEPAAEEPAAELAAVLDAFRTDWRGALFTLAAEKLPAQEIPQPALLAADRRTLPHRASATCPRTPSRSQSSRRATPSSPPGC